jgi:ABC-2 type transport system permease protein
MSKLGILIRTGLKSNFSLAVLYHSLVKQKKDLWLVPIFVLCFAGVLPLLYGIVYLIQRTYLVLNPIGQERALLNLGILAGQTVILLFGIYYVVAAFYFSRDLEILIPMPLKPHEVMVSKFSIILVNEYLTVAAFVLPVLITFGVLTKSGVGYWVNSILVYMTLPVIPLAIVSALVVAMMRFINISRKKDFLILIGGIALIAVVLGFQFLVHRSGNEDINAGNIAAYLSSPNSLLNKIGAFFPPSIWATKAIAGGFSAEGLSNLALFLGASLLLFGILIILAEQLFYKGLVGLSETGIRKRILTSDEMSRRVSSGRRAITTIFIRECRIMNRTPVFLLNGILVVILLPILFILMTQSGAGSMGPNLKQLMESGDSLLIVLILALFMIICGLSNGTSSSTFSREGAQFWISRIIPVAPWEQITAKFLHSYMIGLLGIAAAFVVTIIILHPTIIHLALATGLALVAGILLTAIGMIIDLARPLLDWTNPQKAMKQNLNVLLGMFADAGILAAAYFALKPLMKAEVSATLIIWGLFAILAILATLSYLALLKFAQKRYREMEN